MKVSEAIDRARRMRPAAMDEMSALYYEWLTDVEQEVIDHMNRHEDPDGAAPDTLSAMDPLNIGPERAEYTAEDWQPQRTYTEADADAELLLPVKYQMAYVYRLMCEIDLMNGETERYNNDATLYNQTLAEWKAEYRREHRPRRQRRRDWRVV